METNIKPKLSIVIPVYQMENGEHFLRSSLEMLKKQTFTDFEVVIPENNTFLSYQHVLNEFSQLTFNYFLNPSYGMAANTNAGLQASKGELIKILYQDDMLAHEHALETIIERFTGNWLITGCDTNELPCWTSNLVSGNNKLGSPSVLTIRNTPDPLLFDESLKWLLDCDYYQRMYEQYGRPTIVPGLEVLMGVGTHQQTNILTDDLKAKEQVYLANKHEN